MILDDWSTAEICMNVERAARMWKHPPYRNSHDIAKALRISEPEALRLLDIARKGGLLEP